MGVGGEATILQRNYLDWTSRDARSTRLCECTFSFPLDNQKEKRMLLLVARGERSLCQISRVISSRARSICSS